MFVHGNNLDQKEAHPSKYRDATSRQYLKEIRAKYNEWRKANSDLVGPGSVARSGDDDIIIKRVKLLNDYKDFLDQQHFAEKFDSRSNLHSSVLEEFMFYLFKDMVSQLSGHALLGKSHTFKDLFFRPSSYEEMLKQPHMLIEKKDHDFAIGVKLSAIFRCEGQVSEQADQWDIPAVAVECKTYLDKTMLQDASTAADQLKQRNPNALYIVVAEWLKLTDAVNLKKFKIDQIYVLRKQKNTDREFRFEESYEKNPIYADPVIHLFASTRTFLTSSWEGGVSYGLNRGYLI